MDEMSEFRGNKRACTSHPEVKPRYVHKWFRMTNKLRIQHHVEMVLKVLISLSMPLMSILKQVLAMMMRVAEIEEMEVLQDMMEEMIQEKKNMEKGKSSKKSHKASSVTSFELISGGSEVSWMGTTSHTSRSPRITEPAVPTRWPVFPIIWIEDAFADWSQCC